MGGIILCGGWVTLCILEQIEKKLICSHILNLCHCMDKQSSYSIFKHSHKIFSYCVNEKMFLMTKP